MRNCDVCGADLSGGKLLYKKESVRSAGPKGPYELVRCSHCGFVSVANQPSPQEIAEIYRHPYHMTGQGSDAPKGLSAERLNSLARLRQLEKLKKGGKLLDIGCGTGIFLDVAKRSYEVTGVELSADAVRQATSKFGLVAFQGDFETLAGAELSGSVFDVVTMWDVLGHLRSPRRALSLAHAIMAPGGILALSTPDIMSLTARVCGRRWHLLTPPEMLHFFCESTLIKLLVNCGFQLISSRKPGKYVSVDFLLDKVKRLYGWSWLAKLATSRKHQSIYINLFDILTVYACRNEVAS